MVFLCLYCHALTFYCYKLDYKFSNHTTYSFFCRSKTAIYFEETKVTISESSSNIIETIYARYYRYIISGFLSGFATKLLDNWINIGAISFLWFLINFLIITIIIALVLKEDIFD
jgi:hypothetical protein